MQDVIAGPQKSTIGRTGFVTRDLSLPSGAASRRRKGGNTVRHAPTRDTSSMPMLRRLIRLWVDVEIDLAGLGISEQDILDDLSAGRQ